eukprot:COSAG05_NODE_23421_length_258_cov_0.654088_1_plen_56_part_01
MNTQLLVLDLVDLDLVQLYCTYTVPVQPRHLTYHYHCHGNMESAAVDDPAAGTGSL